MNLEQAIGILAGIFTSASLLPQLIKTIREKEAKSLSALMMVVLLTGLCLWVFYGFLKEDLPIIITNSFSVVINGLLLFFSLKYKKANGD